MVMLILILISSDYCKLHLRLKMGPRKIRHPPKFSVDPDYQIYRDKLMRWIEVADYSRSEIASLIVLGLPSDVKEKCMEDIGDCFLGKKSLFKVIQWLDSTFDLGWITWLDNARKNEECYVTFVPVPHGALTYKMYERFQAYPRIKDHAYMTWMICPIDEEPFEVWSGNKFKKHTERSEYIGKYFKKKRAVDPNCVIVMDYTDDGLPLGTHLETNSDYYTFLDSNVTKFNVSHKAVSHS